MVLLVEELKICSIFQIQLFKLAKSHKGTYDGECPFYCSCSGYNVNLISNLQIIFLFAFVHIVIDNKNVKDELIWAATWLYKATRKEVYLSYLKFEAISAYVAEFSWDLKYAGAQILIVKVYIYIQSYTAFSFWSKPIYE